MRGRSYFKLDGDYTPLNFTPLFISLPITLSHSISTRSLSLSFTTYHSLSTHALCLFLTLSKYTLPLFFSLSTQTHTLSISISLPLSHYLFTHTHFHYFSSYFSLSLIIQNLCLSQTNNLSFFYVLSHYCFFLFLSLKIQNIILFYSSFSHQKPIWRWNNWKAESCLLQLLNRNYPLRQKLAHYIVISQDSIKR